ncbi:hypothetical protein HD554DRAFT_2173061 [Boletus coccyginus]|nr:hypothetical protein HD554DRAFT_2173061 [Boletus coccyginus]
MSPWAEEEYRGTLATLPVLGAARRQQDVLAYQALISSHRFEFAPVAATPEGGSQRYKPRPAVHGTDPPLEIPAGQQKLLSALPPPPDQWRRHVHPEGNVLFYHAGLRVFTENDISDPEKEKEILFCVTRLLEQATLTQGVTLNELTEIVVNVDSDHKCHYYFVDHTYRLLFWLEPRSMEDLNVDLQGITKYSHIIFQYIAYNMESRSHCEYHPHNRTLPDGAFEDLRGMLNYFKTDMMTTDSSSSPFTQDELTAFLDIVSSLKVHAVFGPLWVPLDMSDSLFLNTIPAENQFLNFYGQSCARLNADTPLFGQQSWNTRFAFKAVNLFLFGAPNGHALRLKRVWVDGIIIQPRWKDFITRLREELGRYTIFSTVMLAVNFSFLAVPGVVNQASAAAPTPTAGPIEIAIYCSVVSTVGSIVFSFGLLNVYSDPGLMVARNAVEAMWTLSQTKTGMAFLAITHSLPMASLIWSIVCFSAALAVQIFGPKHLATVATLSVEYFIIVFFAVMGVVVMRWFYRNHDGDGDDVDPSAEKDPAQTGLPHDVEQG